MPHYEIYPMENFMFIYEEALINQFLITWSSMVYE